MNSKHKEILELSVSEKILLVEEIWDSIVAENALEATALTKTQKSELSRRLNLYKSRQTKTHSWDEVKYSLKN